MKFNKKNGPVFVKLLLFGALAGTLFWELSMRFLEIMGIALDLTAGPIGFDVGALQMWLSINPGTFLGLAMGWLLFSKI
jgi:hypothetical protein